MGLLDFLGAGDDRNPANAAMPFLDKISPMLKEHLNPYISRGTNAFNKTNPIYESMGTDPVAFLESIMGRYQPSTSFKLRRDNILRSAGNTAAAGGMRGSLQDIDAQGRLTDSLLGDDMQQWLQNVLGIQGRGLEGEKHFFDTGFDATKTLSGDLSNVLGTQATLAFQGQAERNKALSDLIQGLTQAGGAIAGFGMPGGGTFGGAIASKFI